MTRRWLQSALIVCAFAAALQGQSRETLLDTVYKETGWTSKGAPAVFDSTNIEAFDRRLAPALKRYGLKGVTVQDWQGPAGRVRTTFFEMLDAGAAYGLFTIRRSAEGGTATQNLTGAESFQAKNSLYFWQSNYVVRVEGAPQAVGKMAGGLAERILGRSRKPPVSNHLPPRNLVPGTDQYVLSADHIDRALGIDPARLGFEDDVEVATATYRVDGHGAHVILLLYPTQQLAKKYAEQILAAKPGFAELSKRVGPLIAIVSAPGAAPAVAESILGDINYETKVTWNQPRPSLNIAEVILTVFTFIGLALAFTVFAGIGFGGVRVFVKSRYPNRLFDRPEDMEIIQLKLGQSVIRKELQP